MTDTIDRRNRESEKRSKALMIVTSVFGLLYLWFIIISFIPAPEGSWISTTVPFEPFDLEQILVKLMFLLFLIGYTAVWKSELIGGLVFVLWWVAMWCLEVFVLGPLKGEGGGGIVMGLPLFVLGGMFLLRWYNGRIESVPSSTSR